MCNHSVANQFVSRNNSCMHIFGYYTNKNTLYNNRAAAFEVTGRKTPATLSGLCTLPLAVAVPLQNTSRRR